MSRRQGRPMPRLAELPYVPDSAAWFSLVAHSDFSIFLDSGTGAETNRRHDIILADPVNTIQADIATARSEGSMPIANAEELFSLLRQAMLRSEPSEFPFDGGLAGFLSYDMGFLTEPLDMKSAPDLSIPDMAVGVYDAALLVDHKQQKCHLVANDSIGEQRWRHFLNLYSSGPKELAPPSAPKVLGPLRASMSRDEYAAAFSRIQRHILDGDCYQINLTQRLSLGYNGDSWELYRYVRAINAAPMAAFMRLPGQAVLSCSPERFLRCSGNRVESSPIKGTRPRASPGYEDRAQAGDLVTSPKDKAENLMIVDLLRNDLARACVPGSIAVPKLFDLQSYTTVHHMVSSISGQLRQDKDCLDLLRACFPGGSITGAPKRRAMQIIEELEKGRRHLYCGSIFYAANNGNMDSNITIRTMVHEAGQLHYWAGGGIVHDSVEEQEYQEMFTKAAVFLRLQDQ